MADPLDSIRDELQQIADAGLRRRLRPIDGPQAAEVIVDGRRALNFSSNNYLGLADHPALVEAACRAMDEGGVDVPRRPQPRRRRAPLRRPQEPRSAGRGVGVNRRGAAKETAGRPWTGRKIVTN